MPLTSAPVGLQSPGAGVYSANAFRGSDLSFRARYFHEHRSGLRARFLDPFDDPFYPGQRARPALLEGSLPYDVMFCRNLLIYLGIPARVCVLAIIERLLKVDGLLFIGHADRLDMAGVEPKFTADGDPACFVYRPRTRGDALPSRQPLDESWALSRSVEGGDESSGPVVSTPIVIAPPKPASQIDTANHAKVPDEQSRRSAAAGSGRGPGQQGPL